MSDDCTHLKGSWRRQGRFSILDCENGDYRTIIDIDSPDAFELFEEGEGVVQQFGKPLRCTGDDAERLQRFKDDGLVLPEDSEASPSRQGSDLR